MMEKKIFDDDDYNNDGLGVVGVYDAYSGGGFVCIFCFVVSLVSE